MKKLKNTKILENSFKYEPIIRPVQRIKPNGVFIGKNETVYDCNEQTGSVTFDMLMKSLKEGREYEIVGFLYGLVIYAGKRLLNDIEWDYSITEKDPLETIIKCLTDNKIPAYLKDELYYFCNKPPLEFEKYLELCRRQRIFNLKSAKNVYKLQGDEGIPVILQQIFTPPIDEEYTILPDKNVKINPPKIDFGISGTFFPCYVTKTPKNMKIEVKNSAIFISGQIDRQKYIIDIYCVGNYPLYDKSFSERVSFLGAAGVAAQGFVCYNYLELIDAVNILGDNCLIRNLREDLINTSWFNWGKDSTIDIEIKENRVKGTTGKTKIQPIGEYDKSHPYVKINMEKKIVGQSSKEKIIFTSENIEDFFELYNLQRAGQ